MNRYNKPEFEVKTKVQKDRAELLTRMEEDIFEIVGREGKLIGWSNSEEHDDYIIELQRFDKVDITKNFPTRYAEKDGKLVIVTKENIKDHDKLLKKIPEKYMETLEV